MKPLSFRTKNDFAEYVKSGINRFGLLLPFTNIMDLYIDFMVFATTTRYILESVSNVVPLILGSCPLLYKFKLCGHFVHELEIGDDMPLSCTFDLRPARYLKWINININHRSYYKHQDGSVVVTPFEKAEDETDPPCYVK